MFIPGHTARSFINVYENCRLEFAHAFKVVSGVRLPYFQHSFEIALAINSHILTYRFGPRFF